MTTKERPIIFSGPMVRAILEGKKTQTRRVAKGLRAEGVGLCHWSKTGWAHLASDGGCTCQPVRCPYGKPGDRLWVRETWLHIDDEGDKFDGMGSQTYYRASSGPRDAEYMEQRGLVWRPSIFMPRWASRITLEITGVRVERLQQISEADAMAEGCPLVNPDPFVRGHGGSSASGWFPDLWESINGDGSWDANPWVWVLEFRRLQGVAA